MDQDFARAADARSVDELRAGGGIKWSLFPDRIGAFVAEADFGTAPAVRRALLDAVAADQFGYLPPTMTADMSRAFAAWSAQRYDWQIPTERIRPVADVLAVFRAAVQHFSAPGSAVILPTPAYMPFLTVPATLGRRVIQVPMVEVGGRAVYDLDALDAAFRDGGGLLVLCNPHNPVGRVLERDEMLAVAEVVERHGGRVFSDEIHAPLVYPGHTHVPYASLDDVTAGHTVTATSASKAWNLPGLKCAQLVLSNAADAARWREVGEETEHGASTLGVLANTAAYRDGGAWLGDLVSYLDGNRRLLAELVAEQLPGVRLTPPEGTYLAWLDCRALGLGDSPAPFFAEHAGVALTDGPACGAAGAGFVRYNLATPRPILRTTLTRLAESLSRR